MRTMHPGMALVLFTCLSMNFSAQAASANNGDMDVGLRAEIGRIRAIDAHTHVDANTPGHDSHWRAESPLDRALDPGRPVAIRRGNPAWMGAWKALYGYRYNDLRADHLAELLEEKRRRITRAGTQWPAQVLDAAGIDVALVINDHLGPGQDAPRFRWVPYADALLTPHWGDRSVLDYPGYAFPTINNLKADAAIVGTQPSLDAYATAVIQPVLAHWVAAGVPSIKFLLAYWRALDVAVVSRDVASRVYERAAHGEVLTAADEKLLQDYLFIETCARAGALGIVVQIHSGHGVGDTFQESSSNPLMLEPALTDARLRDTRFVLVHGGWPYPLLAQAMMAKPNTYADFSNQAGYLTTHALAQVLRGWLGWYPEKVMFGTDAEPSSRDSPLTDHEEMEWLLTEKSRDAVAIALTGMIRDHEITRQRASEIARLVFRDNAIRVYHLGK